MEAHRILLDGDPPEAKVQNERFDLTWARNGSSPVTVAVRLLRFVRLPALAGRGRLGKGLMIREPSVEGSDSVRPSRTTTETTRLLGMLSGRVMAHV